MSVGTLAVTANEVTKDLASKKVYTVAEEQFIASYEKDGVSDVAKYFIDNNISVSEAQFLTDKYVEAKELDKMDLSKKNVTGSRTIPAFYCNTHLSDNQHYCVLISNNGAYNDNVDLNLEYTLDPDDTWITSLSNLSIRSLNSGVTLSGQSMAGYSWYIHGAINLNGSSSQKLGVCDFPFNVCGGATNELELYNELHWDGNGNYDPLTFATYVQGDINHDGIVDYTDYSWIVDYCLRKNPPIPTNYSNFDAETAAIINNLAADADRNGELSLSDITWIVHHADDTSSFPTGED